MYGVMDDDDTDDDTDTDTDAWPLSNQRIRQETDHIIMADEHHRSQHLSTIKVETEIHDRYNRGGGF
jgi:uncharacterized protein YqjF (DUF2071 family)